MDVREFVKAGQWSRQRLSTYLSDDDIVQYICNDIKSPCSENEVDKAWWMGNASGMFSVKSAWELIRIKNK